MRRIRCRGLVTADVVIANAIVTIEDDGKRLISAEPFSVETAATSEYDGIFIAGDNASSIETTAAKIVDKSNFLHSLSEISSLLTEGDTLVRIPL